MYKRFILVFVMLALLAPAAAQEDPDFVLAYIKEGNVWLRDANGADFALTDDAQIDGAYHAVGHSMLRWSPDGKWLAYIYSNRNTGEDALYAVDVTAPEMVPKRLASELAAAHPPAWRDAATLTYLTFGTDMQELTIDANLYAVAPDAETPESTLLGTYRFGQGCGGGSSDPATHVYSAETHGLFGYHLTFAWSGSLLVHSPDCTGRGVWAFNVDTQTDAPVAEALSRTAVSPDKLYVAGILDPTPEGVSKIHIYNLANLDLPPTEIIASDVLGTEAAQLGWDVESTDLYYSLQQYEEERTFSEGGGIITVYFSGLRHYNIATQTNARVYTASAYAFASIAPLDANNVLFTQIDNATQWFEAYQEGASEADLLYNLPKKYIVHVTLDPAGAEIVLEGGGEPTVRP